MLGARIRAIRESQKKSMSELANACGVNVVHISDIERERRFPSLELLEKIANYLDRDVFELKDLYHRDKGYISFDLFDKPKIVQNMMVELACKWDNISEEKAKQIIEVLSNKKD